MGRTQSENRKYIRMGKQVNIVWQLNKGKSETERERESLSDSAKPHVVYKP